MLSPFQVTALPCSMAKARGASSFTWAPFPWGQGFSPPLLVIFRRRYFMSRGQKQIMFMNNGNFLSVTETQIFRETSTTNMWRNYFSKLTKNYLLTELNKQNISFWSPCREILVSCFFQYLFSEAIAITRKKKKYISVGFTSLFQHTVVHGTTWAIHHLISNNHKCWRLPVNQEHFSLDSYGYWGPSKKEGACSWYMQCFTWQT